MNKKLLSSIMIVLAIIVVVTTGATYAYFYATTTNTNAITGEEYGFNVNLALTEIYKADNLVPLEDGLVDDAILKTSNKCIDSKGYEVCTLYKVTLTNSGNTQVLNGYISTSSTTYTTDNLKYQIFDTSYNAITDVMTVSRTLNEKIYFKNKANLITTTVNTDNVDYYLVLWLTETNSSQEDDYDKDFSGIIGFESSIGEFIEASF